METYEKRFDFFVDQLEGAMKQIDKLNNNVDNIAKKTRSNSIINQNTQNTNVKNNNIPDSKQNNRTNSREMIHNIINVGKNKNINVHPPQVPQKKAINSPNNNVKYRENSPHTDQKNYTQLFDDIKKECSQPLEIPYGEMPDGMNDISQIQDVMTDIRE